MSETQHVMPVNDLMEHVPTALCSCHPSTERVAGGFIVVHNAWDKRELRETTMTSGGDVQGVRSLSPKTADVAASPSASPSLQQRLHELMVEHGVWEDLGTFRCSQLVSAILRAVEATS